MALDILLPEMRLQVNFPDDGNIVITYFGKNFEKNVKADIYFTAAGLFYIPAEQRLIDTMQILKQKNAEKSAEIKELWCNPMTGITP